MKLTNKMGLPEPIYNAVKNDSYGRGDADISVTQLIAPPRQVALIRTHLEEIEEDCSDRIFSLLGQAVHTILERANQTGIAERRLSIEVEGWKVSGGMDLVCAQGKLSDYKVTTSYKFKNNQVPIEFEQQLNIYAEILRQNGEPVSGLQIVGILRDWSKLEARRDPEYPQSQVVILPVTLWPSDLAQRFIRSRVILHQQARLSLPECTPEERWAKPTKFAVMKAGKDRAIKLYENEDDARSHASTDKSLRVEVRPGESVRCAAYCSAAKFCTQYQPNSLEKQASEVA